MSDDRCPECGCLQFDVISDSGDSENIGIRELECQGCFNVWEVSLYE